MTASLQRCGISAQIAIPGEPSLVFILDKKKIGNIQPGGYELITASL
jgi:hypothetical protein